VQKFLAPFPLVRIVIPLAAGIAIGLSHQFDTTPLAVAIVLLLFAMLLLGNFIRRSSKYYLWHGLAAFAFFLTTGTFLANMHLQMNTQSASAVQKDVPVLVRIISDPESRENNVRCRARVIAVYSDSGVVNTDAVTMLYLKRNKDAETLRYGDEILVEAGVKDPSPVMNPGEFDYAKWLHSQGVYFVCFARDQWKHSGFHSESWIKQQALILRRYFKERLQVCGLSGQELAVSEALLLGQSSDIDPGLLASYSASGTLHVLSVSGMHVALVFVVLLKLLAPLEKNKKTKWISFVIQFAVIWFYAFMTGMSPSVLRSVMMLSVIITGRVIKRNAHLLNTLSASAIILLIGNPQLLVDAGFLLSYCAVGGIVIVQPMLENVWSPQNRLVKPVWSLVSVTLAAQVFTFPLGLYFFQQFPTWFIVSNLVIIPLSTICLYAGLFFLCTCWWTWAGTLFAYVLGFLIALLNTSVSFTEYLPAAVLQTANWSGFEITILYSMIILFLIAFAHRQKRVFIAGLSFLLILLFDIALVRNRDLAIEEFTVFHMRDGLAIGVRSGNEATIFIDSLTALSPEQLNFHVLPDYERADIRNLSVLRMDTLRTFNGGGCAVDKGWLNAMSLRVWLGGKNDLPTTSDSCDILLVHSKNFFMLEDLHVLTPKQIVISGEVKKKWIAKWEEDAKNRGIACYSTSISGALVVSN